MKILVYIVLTAVFILSTAFEAYSTENTPVVIQLKNGAVLKCKINEYVPGIHIKVETSYNKTLVFPVDQICEINSFIDTTIENKYKNTIDSQLVNNIGNSNYYNSSYLESGLNLGTPGFINFDIGYWFKGMGFRYSYGFLDKARGCFQLTYHVSLFQNKNICHSVFAGITTSRTELDGSKNYSAYIVGYDLKVNSLHFMTGVGYDKNNKSRFQIQIGYISKIRL